MNRAVKLLVKVFFMIICLGAALVLYDPANIVVVQAMAIGIFLVGGSHLTRRILLDRMDIQDIALRSIAEGSMPGAIIFVGVLWFLVQIMQISMSVLK